MENQKELNDDPQMIFEDYLKLAEQGDPDAQFNLAEYYFNDNDELSAEKAFEWYQKAAEQGHSDAQYKLGYCYYYSIGVPLSLEKAAEWYQKAAEQGHSAAQYELGICYKYGDGVPKSIKKAVYWFQKADECNPDAYVSGDSIQRAIENTVDLWLEAALKRKKELFPSSDD